VRSRADSGGWTLCYWIDCHIARSVTTQEYAQDKRVSAVASIAQHKLSDEGYRSLDELEP
jgi:hypothetical protein